MLHHWISTTFTHRIRWVGGQFAGRTPTVWIAAAVFVIATASSSYAVSVTSPPGDGVDGNLSSEAPFTRVGDTNGNRYQQIYSSSFFSGVGPRQSISAVAFRPRQGAFLSFIGNQVSFTDLLVNLSTTTRTPDTTFPTGLSADLDLNVGSNAQTVFSGPLTLSTDRLFGDTDVEDFDFLIEFTDPYFYELSAGNLLLEVIVPAAARVTSNGNNFTQLAQFIDGFPSTDGTASAIDANLTDGLSVGRNSSTGAVTQFTTTAVSEMSAIPEPGSIALLGGMGITALAARRRRLGRRAAGSSMIR